MRINKFVALSSGLSRRKADDAIINGRITVNGKAPEQGQSVTPTDTIKLDGVILHAPKSLTIMLNKPAGYVVSRDGQGSQTIYDLLDSEYQNLNPVGRLDKYSSGLLLMTNDGDLAHTLTHPSKQKIKVYELLLDKPLEPLHHQMITDHGIQLDDGLSKLQLTKKTEGDSIAWTVAMHEGRNRQIRRTFEALGYRVTHLHRIKFDNYDLANLKSGKVIPIEK